MTNNKNNPVPEKTEKKVEKKIDGAKVMTGFAITGKILLRVLSYAVNILLTVLLVGMICAVIVGTVFAVYIKNNLDLEIDSSLLVTAGTDTTTRIYYMDYETEEDRLIRNGTPVELEDERLYGSVNSLWADYSSMPADLINAFISVEDRRFKTHNGVDLLGTGKAVVNYFVGFEDIRGASTITQQLVKNLTGDDDVSIQRKVEEIFRALNLEKQLSKEEILEMYLNIVYLGNNCYGVKTAANTYFGKDVSELTLVECAALAAIVKNPSRYEPVGHDYFTYTDENGEEQEDGNKIRRGTVLWLMRNEGYISEATYQDAINQELQLDLGGDSEDEEKKDDEFTVHSWYVDSVVFQIIDDLMEKNDWTYALASTKLYTSGYNIYIPMDPEIQEIMEEVFADTENLPRAQEGLQPQSAMVVTDPYTGDVLGLVGGTGEKQGNLILNRATEAVRPIGSSIKPIAVYGPAMDAGIIKATSLIEDSPVMYNEIVHGAGTSWEWVEKIPYPKNYPNYYREKDITITEGVTQSINTIAMKVLQKLTIDESFDFMKNTLHVDSLIESKELSNGSVITDKGLAALSLGQLNYGMTVLEAAAAYSIFPNNGLYESPNLYLYVTDSSGQVVLENEHHTEVALKEVTAKTMTAIMMNVMSSGTGTSVTLRHQIETAGKTGTTNADFDRYFVGYTPYYVGAVWTGYDINSSLSAYRTNPSCTIWDMVMTKIHQKYIDAAADGEEELKRFDLEDADEIFIEEDEDEKDDKKTENE